MIRTEIERILITHLRTRYAKVLIEMRAGFTDAQLAEVCIKERQPNNAESVAAARRLVRISLDDELVPASSEAAAQAGCCRD